jgi:hypothetical protein
VGFRVLVLSDEYIGVDGWDFDSEVAKDELDVGVVKVCTVLGKPLEALAVGSIGRDFDCVGVNHGAIVIHLRTTKLDEDLWNITDVFTWLHFNKSLVFLEAMDDGGKGRFDID